MNSLRTYLILTILATMILLIFLSAFRGYHKSAEAAEVLLDEQLIEIAKMLNLDIELIRKGSIKNTNFTSKRPLNTSLSNQLAKKILKTQPLSLKKWLENFDMKKL